jgi:uncharacterized lipoprotein NlpE involved in copper resistance
LRHSIIAVFALVLVLAGCTGHQQTDTSASPSPTVVVTNGPESAATSSPTTVATAVAVTTATPASGPVAPNTTPAGKALNRRVELLRL